MAAAIIQAKAQAFTAPNATGNQAYTGIGFQPEIVIAAGGGTAVNSSNTVARMLFSAAKSSSSRANAAFYSRNSIATSETSHDLRTDYFMAVPAGSGSDANVDVAEFVTMDADGYTLNWPSNLNGQSYPSLAVRGGSSKIGSLDLNTSTGNQAVTGVGFRPNVVILWTSAQNTTEGGAAEGYFSIGAGVSPSKRCSYAWRDRDNLADSDAERYSTSSNIYTEISAGAVTAQADLVSLDSDGFTINVTTAPAAARRILYLAIGGVSADIGGFTSKTTTGNQAYTGVGFQPTALIMFANDNTVAQLDAVTAGAEIAIGFATSSGSQGAASASAQDNAANMGTSRHARNDICIETVTPSATFTLITQAALVSMDADGFTLNWSTASATARQCHYIALR